MADPSWTKVADGFYQNAATYAASTDFYITNLNGLKFFRDIVNGETAASYAYFAATGVTGSYPMTPAGINSFHSNNMFNGKTVHLVADIDLAGEQWITIGFNRAGRTITDPDTSVSASVQKCTFFGLFDAGIYDGEGNLTGTHVISNLDTSWQYVPEAATLQAKYQLTGLFGQLSGGTTAGVKNLTVRNATVVGRMDVGVIAGRSYDGGAKIENCHVVGNVNVSGTGTYVGGLVGECRASIVNSSVDAAVGSSISGLAYVGGLAGSVFQYNANDSVEVSGNTVSQTAVSASYSGVAGVGALVGVTNPSGTYNGNVVISGNEANNVPVSAPNSSASKGGVGTLVGNALYDDGAYAIVADNTVSGTTAATAGGEAVTTKMGAANDNFAVGANITFDANGKVTGGIFEVINEELIASGYMTVANLDPETSANYPLKVGGPYVAAIYDENGALKQGYTTFDAAIAAAQTEDVIKVLKNLALSSGVQQINKKLVIDLNGFAFGCVNSPLGLGDSGDVTIRDSVGGGYICRLGNINDMTSRSTGACLSINKGRFVLESGKIDQQTGTALTASGTGTVEVKGGVVDGATTVGSANTVGPDNGTFILSGGKIIRANGTGLVTLTMNGGNLTVKGGEIVGGAGTSTGVRLNSGKMTLEDGLVVGRNAIDVRGGELVVTGGKVTSENGTAIYASQGSDSSVVSVSGGVVKSVSGVAISTGKCTLTISGEAEVSGKTNAIVSYDDTSATISGGTISSETSTAVWANGNVSLTVSGGDISSKNATVVFVEPSATATFTGGKLSALEGNRASLVTVRDGGKLSISDGVFHLGVPDSQFIISGAGNPGDASAVSEIAVSGGYFTTKVADNHLATGYVNLTVSSGTPEPFKVVISTCTVTFKDGDVTTTQTYNYGAEISNTPEEPANKIFKGWYLVTGDTVAEEAFAGGVTDNITLQAVWADVVATTTIGGVTKKYETLQEALDAAEADNPENIVIDLLGDATLDITARANVLSIGTESTKTITINGNNHALTFNQTNSDWNDVSTANDAQTKLILNDMSISNSGHNDGPWNRHDINFSCAVELNKVTSDKALAFKNAATLNNVTVTDTGDIYGIWIQPNGQTVSIDVLTVTCGRGIKIDDQYVDAKNTTLNIKDATFNTTDKSAILVKSGAKTQVNASGTINIENVAKDNQNLVWVDEDAAERFGDVTVTGATVVPEGGPTAYAATLSSDGKIEGYYKSLDDVVAAYEEGDTITALNYVEGTTVVPEGWVAKTDAVTGVTTIEEYFAAQIGETKYKTLPNAFAALSDGDTLTILADGTYTLPGITGKTVTIQAADGVEATFDVTNQTGMSDSKLTFKNIIFDYYPNKNYTGLAHVDTVTYDNCTWNGMVFLYGNVETFNNCTFNQNSSDAYNVWTYGADKVVFNECTFNSAGKSVLVYSEGSDQFNDVTVTKCTFNASEAVEGKAAIEIDTSLTAGATITVDDQTTVSDTFASGNVSGSKVYNNKKGSSGVNNDITVVIAGKTVLEPVFAAQIGTKKYETIAEAFAAAADGDKVTLLKDVSLTDRLFVNAGATPAFSSNGRYATTSENKSITLDLNGKNITSSSNIALAGGSLTITGSGTISTTTSGLAPVEIYGTGTPSSKRTLKVDKNVTLTGSTYGLNVFGTNDKLDTANYIDVTVDGTVNGTIFVLGNLTNADNEINIVVNGTVNAPAGEDDNANVGIALNGNANVTVNAPAVVSGDSGIEVRAGTLTVNGGTITGTAETYSYKANGSGSTTKGAAIVVAQHTTVLGTAVTLNGGKLEGVKTIGVTDVNGNMDNVEVLAKHGYTASSSIPEDYKWVESDTEGMYKLVKKDYVAQVVREEAVVGKYESLDEAIAAANDGDTIQLLANINATASSLYTDKRIPISKSLTIDGQNHTITVAQRGFGVGMNASSKIDVTFKDVTINNSSDGARCIDTRGNLNSLTLNHVTLDTNGGSGYTQPLTIGGKQADAATVSIVNGSKIQTNDEGTAYYAIITFNPVKMTIENSTIKGWACIYAKGPDGSAGSAGSVFTITDSSNLVSKNVYSGESNAFSMLRAEDDNVTFNITDTKIDVSATGDQTLAIVGTGGSQTDVMANLGEGNEVTLSGEATFALNSGNPVVSGGIFNVEVPEGFCATGYIPTSTTEDGVTTYGVKQGTYVAQVFTGETAGQKYESLEAAFAAANSGDIVEILVSEVELPATAVIPAGVTLTGKGAHATTVKITTTNGDGVKITNPNVKISNLALDGSAITSGGYKSLVNVEADGCVIDGVVFTGGGMSTWNSSILVERIPETGTFTVKNSNISGSFRGVLRESCDANIVIENCDITAIYPFNIDGGSAGTVTVSGSKLHGWTSYSGVKKVTFTNCEFTKGPEDCVAAYVDTEFNGCSFDREFQVYAQTSPFTFTFNNCTKNGETVTQESFTNQFSDSDVWVKCDTYVDGKLVGAVAAIGTAQYKSLQSAVDAAHEMTGDVTVEFVADELSGYAIVHQKAGLNLTIDGKGKTLHGQIIVDGDNRSTGAETLTIKDVVFEGDQTHFHSDTDAFVLVPSLKTSGTDYYNNKNNYAHNITIDGCTFTSTSASAEKDVVGFRSSSQGGTAYNVAIRNTTGSNLHSLAQFNPVEGSAVYNCSITDSESFVNVSNGKGSCSIEKCTFSSTLGGYAVRENGSSTTTVILKDNDFSSTNANNEPGNVLVIGKGDSATAGTIKVVDGVYNGDLVKTAAATGNFEITGGRFSVEVPEAYCGKDADGNQLYPIAGLYPDTPATPNGVGPDTVAVAIVTQGDSATTTRYVSLAAAVAAANTGDTVVLLKNIDLANQVKVGSGKTVTIDLAGKTVSNTADIWNDATGIKAWSLISVQGGTLTLKDSSEDGTGKLDAKENDCYALDVRGGSLTVESGTYVGNISAVYVYDGALAITGGKFDIKQLESGEGNDRYRFLVNCLDANYGSGTATVAITGGTFHNFDPADNKAEVAETRFTSVGYVGGTADENGFIPVIEGYIVQFFDEDGTTRLAKYEIAKNATVAFSGTEPTKATTTEYTYQFAGWTADNGTTVSETLPAATADVSYKAVFTPVANVASITRDGNTTYYTTLEAANTASQSGDTITLLQDAKLADRIWVKSGVTIDGANHTIKADETSPNFSDERLITDSNYAASSSLTLINLAGNVTGVTIKNVTLDSNGVYPRALIGTGSGTTITLENVTLNHTSTTIRGADALALDGDCTIVGDFNVAMGERTWSAISFNEDGEKLNLTDCTSFSVTDDKRTGTQPVIIAYFPNGQVTGAENCGFVRVIGANVQTGYEPTTSAKVGNATTVGTVYNFKATVGEDVTYYTTFNLAATAAGTTGTVENFKAPAGDDVYALTLANTPLKVIKNGFEPNLTVLEGYELLVTTAEALTTYTLGEAVATITTGGVTRYYASLQNAVDAAVAGDTVNLIKDATAERTTISKSITVDLGGKTLTGRLTVDDGVVTVQNGTVVGRFDAYDAATVTLAKTATVTGQVVVWGTGTYGETGCKTPTMNVYGTVSNTGDSAITFNGTDMSGAILNIYADATVTSTDHIAIYQPSGNVNVNGGTITGATGIYTKAGALSISGGTISGTGTAAAYTHNGNGANATGDALVVENCGYPNGAPVVSITGGTFRSTNGKQIGSYYGGSATGLASVTANSDGITIPDNEMWVAGETASTYKLVEAVVVTFDADNADGDSDVTTVKIEKGTAVAKPSPDPEKAADAHGEYKFKGWFAPDADEAFDFNKPVTENLELTAHYAFDVLIYPVGQGGVKVDDAWLSDVFGGDIDLTDYDAVIEALSDTADNGIPYWQNYVLGLTGAEGEKLTIWGAAPETNVQTAVPTGNYVIFGELTAPDGWKLEDVKVGTANAKSGYEVKANYKLAVRNANDGPYSIVADATPVPVTTLEPEVKVPMDSVANQTLALVIQITVDRVNTAPTTGDGEGNNTGTGN